MPDLKERPVGATAELGPKGYPQITSRTGGALSIATGVMEPGFNPVDLLLSALASCLTMSARIAARELDVLSLITGFRAEVTAMKDPVDNTKLTAIHVDLDIRGNVTDAMRERIAARADEICTVSNALSVHPIITLRKTDSPAI